MSRGLVPIRIFQWILCFIRILQRYCIYNVCIISSPYDVLKGNFEILALEFLRFQITLLFLYRCFTTFPFGIFQRISCLKRILEYIIFGTFSSLLYGCFTVYRFIDLSIDFTFHEHFLHFPVDALIEAWLLRTS